jgi:hypothetical protein
MRFFRPFCRHKKWRASRGLSDKHMIFSIFVYGKSSCPPRHERQTYDFLYLRYGKSFMSHKYIQVELVVFVAQ